MFGFSSRLTLCVLFCVSTVAAADGALAATPPAFVGPTISHPAVAPDFTLHDQNGRPVRLSGQRGKVVMVTFLYTHCPDVCPLTAVHIEQALDRLGSRRRDVSVLAVSVDPKGDTPSSVRTFMSTHRLRLPFHYLTGSRSVLTRVWRLYNVSAVRTNGPDVDHTLYILLLDRGGKSRVLFDSLAKPAAMTHDLRLLLR
jgi:protein SCO1